MAAEITIKIQGKDQASPVVQGLEDTFSDTFKEISDDLKALKGTFEGVGDDIVKTMEETGDDIRDALKKPVPGVSGPLGPVAGGIVSGLSFVGGIVTKAVGGIVSLIGSALSGLTSIVTGIFRAAFTAAVSVVSSILSGLTSVVGFAFSGLGKVLDTVILGPFRLVFNKITGIIGTAALGWGAKLASDFQDGLTVAFSLIPSKMTPALRTNLQRSMEDLRAEMGVSGLKITQSLYNAISAGAKDAPRPITEAALKFAIVGGQIETADEAIKLFARTANTLKQPLSEVANIADYYSKVVGEGILTTQELSIQMGRVLPFAELLGISLDELLGIIAAMSGKLSPEQVFTGLSAILSRALDPKALAELKTAGANVRDVQGEFISLRNYVEELGRVTLTDKQLGVIFPDIRGTKFYGSLKEDTDFIISKMVEVGKAPGYMAEQWEERLRSVNVGVKRFTGSISNLFSTVFREIEGDVLAVINTAAAVTNNAVEALRAWADDDGWQKLKNSIKGVFDDIGDWLPSLEDVEGAFKTIATTATTAFQGIKNEYKALSEALKNILTGGEVNLNSSVIVTSFRLAFLYIQKYGIEAFNTIKQSISTFFESDTAKDLIQRFQDTWALVSNQGTAAFKSMGIEVIAILEDSVKAGLGTAVSFFGPTVRTALEASRIKAKAQSEQWKREIKQDAEEINKELEAGILRPFKIEIEPFSDRDIRELEMQMRVLTAKAQKGSEEKVDSALNAVKAGIKTVSDAIAPLVDTEKQAADEVKQSADTAVVMLAETQSYMVSIKEAMRETSTMQQQFVQSQGSLNQELVERYKELFALYQEANLFNNALEDSL